MRTAILTLTLLFTSTLCFGQNLTRTDENGKSSWDLYLRQPKHYNYAHQHVYQCTQTYVPGYILMYSPYYGYYYIPGHIVYNRCERCQ